MPTFSAGQQTQFGMAGFGVRPAGSFAGKVAGVILIDPHTATIGPLPLSLSANAIVRLRLQRSAGSSPHYPLPEGLGLTGRGRP